MSTKRLLLACAAIVLIVLAVGVARMRRRRRHATTTAGGTATTAAAGTDTTAAPATGDAIKIGFDEGFTDFMAYDAALADKGIMTALDMLGNQGCRPSTGVRQGRQRLRPGRGGRQGQASWWRATRSASWSARSSRLPRRR